jgi:hypothetical protein
MYVANVLPNSIAALPPRWRGFVVPELIGAATLRLQARAETNEFDPL